MRSYSVRIEKEHACFCSGHFLIFPDGSSEPLHGHNYLVEVEVWGALGEGGLVIDFLKLLPIVREACATFDSRTILPTRNRHLKVRRTGRSINARIGRKRYTFPVSDVVLLPIENSSCELLAAQVGREIARRLGRIRGSSRLEMLCVRIEEAPGQVATFTEGLKT